MALTSYLKAYISFENNHTLTTDILETASASFNLKYSAASYPSKTIYLLVHYETLHILHNRLENNLLTQIEKKLNSSAKSRSFCNHDLSPAPSSP